MTKATRQQRVILKSGNKATKSYTKIVIASYLMYIQSKFYILLVSRKTQARPDLRMLFLVFKNKCLLFAVPWSIARWMKLTFAVRYMNNLRKFGN